MAAGMLAAARYSAPAGVQGMIAAMRRILLAAKVFG
jgi:hypothetical protein